MQRSLMVIILALAAGSCASFDSVKLLGCQGVVCRMLVHAPLISADGGEITVPFDCRSPAWTPDSPKGTLEETKAIAYTVASDRWRTVAFSAQDALVDDNSRDFVPTIPGDYDSVHACAADCGKFVYLARVDPKNPVYHYEIFYSENGKVRQLTHFNVSGGPLSSPRLSADGRTAIVRFGYDIALIDVTSGNVKLIPFGARAWKECSGA